MKGQQYAGKEFIWYWIQTCGNVHSEGDTVMNRLGYPNCFTASIKNRWHHCQYPVQNSLQSNDCNGVHLCLLPDSTVPKLIKNLLLLLVIHTEVITPFGAKFGQRLFIKAYQDLWVNKHNISLSMFMNTAEHDIESSWDLYILGKLTDINCKPETVL